MSWELASLLVLGATLVVGFAWYERTHPSTRVILLGDGRPVADAAPHEVLAGGWYFATQVARVLGGAGGALTPAQGAKVLERVAV